MPTVKIFFITFLISAIGLSAEINFDSVLKNLNAQDTKIYRETLAKCTSGTVGSAFAIGFDSENLVSNIQETAAISTLTAGAINHRLRNGLLSSNLKAIRNSDGFWLAMTTCYGYRYGELNYGNLMKQIVDASQLTNEGLVVVAALYTATKTAIYANLINVKFPILSQFIMAGLISSKQYELMSELSPLIFDYLTDQEKVEYEKAKTDYFSGIKALAEKSRLRQVARLAEIDEQLRSNLTSSTSRERLLLSRQRIQETLTALQQTLSKEK